MVVLICQNVCVCVCLSSQVSASLLLKQQEQPQGKVSNWDDRPPSLAGRAADDAGDCSQPDL